MVGRVPPKEVRMVTDPYRIQPDLARAMLSSGSPEIAP
jgi:hypothetical protein